MKRSVMCSIVILIFGASFSRAQQPPIIPKFFERANSDSFGKALNDARGLGPTTEFSISANQVAIAKFADDQGKPVLLLMLPKQKTEERTRNVTITKRVPEQRTRTVVVEGKTQEQTYTLMVPVPQTLEQKFTASIPGEKKRVVRDFDQLKVVDLDGNLLTEDQARQRLATAQRVVMLRRFEPGKPPMGSDVGEVLRSDLLFVFLMKEAK